jgi:hypothetical protein
LIGKNRELERKCGSFEMELKKVLLEKEESLLEEV